MKVNPARSISYFYRLSNNPQSLLKVFSVWAVVAFVAVGIFGIYPQIRILVQNVKLYPLLRTTNQGLGAKVTNINEEYVKIENNNKAVILLDSYLPDDADIHKYLLDLSFVAGKSGFQLTRLTSEGVAAQASGEIRLQVGFSGAGSVTGLVDAVESLKRVARVEDVQFTRDQGEDLVVMGINIFISEEQ